MTNPTNAGLAKARKQKVREAVAFLQQVGFGSRQTNDTAAYSLLSCLGLTPEKEWLEASDPLVGITPIIEFVRQHYGVKYAPNTRETIRDEAVKHFVGTGLLLRNPDNPDRPTNSGKTVYQIEPAALKLAQSFGHLDWPTNLESYLQSKAVIVGELRRRRELAMIPVRFPNGETVALSPGGQNPLIKEVIEQLCPRFSADGVVVYIGDSENKFLHLDSDYLHKLGVTVPAPAKMPDVIIHDVRRNWLLLIEAVSSAGPVDAKRRGELKELFRGCTAGLVFVSAFATRAEMRAFLTQISWETEVWIAEDPAHMIHFNGERYLGPYPDAVPPAHK
ncbi:MAG: BsuBI/PstI family type II restriction endonuclease [Kiritimatiellaeota bacterium]|nr:BsuBI/PstI family type II restriction endonuclease [Kiritimatiellota bacterium]